MLAVTLGQLELSNLLMEYGALVNTENNESWTGKFHLTVANIFGFMR